MTEVLRARDILARMDMPCNVWSVTSYNELVREAQALERQELLRVGDVDALPYVQSLLAEETGVFIAASDYMKALPGMIAPWVPGPYTVLGTDGFGLSESRERLRDHFEVSGEWIAFAALSSLARNNRLPRDAALDFAKRQRLDLEKADSATW